MFDKNSEPQVLAHTYELGQARLRLRSDLKFTLHNDSASPWYLIEDEADGRFFRLGVAEYAFLSLLNGRRTLDEAIAKLASLTQCDDLSEHEVASLARWVIDSGLAETSAVKTKCRIDDRRGREMVQQRMQWLNPVAFRIPLFNPDRLLSRLYTIFRSVSGWPLVFVWMVVCLIGMFTFAMEAGDFWRHQIQSISGMDFLWLAASWLVLKVLHEAAHGLVCKHYGGRTSQFGVLMLLLVPLPYVDVSSSWRFGAKVQRILTAAAGMLAEGFVASIAIVVWANSAPGPLQYHMGNLFLAATINTVLFNANPLMKFDGYYILVDWLEIPNLYTRGRAFVKSWFKWAFFGVAFQTETESSSAKVRIVRTYGVLAMLWFVLICVSLGTAAVNMFSGIGLVVAVLAMALWIGLPIFQLCRYLLLNQKTENPSRVRFFAVTGFVFAALFALAVLVPAPETISAPVIIMEDEVAQIRTRAAGFVRSIHVSDGQLVAKGDLLIKMQNPQLAADIERLTTEISASRLKASVHKNDGDLGTWQIEVENCAGLEKQRDELRNQLQQLRVIAPTSGIVNAANLKELDQVYLTVGEDLLTIQQANSKRIVAMLPQHDAVWIRSRTDLQDVSVRFWGRTGEGIRGRILEISPRATDRVPHFAFASTNGGPLNVVSRRQVDVEVAAGASPMRRRSANLKAKRSQSLVHFATYREVADEQLKLIQQHVPVVIEIAENDAEDLRTGQAGIVAIGGRDASLGDYLFRNLKRWIASKIQLTHGI